MVANSLNGIAEPEGSFTEEIVHGGLTGGGSSGHDFKGGGVA